MLTVDPQVGCCSGLFLCCQRKRAFFLDLFVHYRCTEDELLQIVASQESEKVLKLKIVLTQLTQKALFYS